MGRKKSKNTAPVPAPEFEDTDTDFAASLLADMGLEEPESSPQEVTVAAPQEDGQNTAGSKRKRNRRKEKLAKRQAETQKMMDEAEEEAAGEPQYRKIEMEQLQQKFKTRNLVEVDIRPDGNCLFSSISDQLELRSGIEITAQELRKTAAEYILDHRDEFIPFMFSEETGELRDIDEYCADLVSTPMWGGEMEVLALSSSFETPIEVLQAGPSHIVGENFTKEKLLVSYYTKIYGLGAHYNSVRDS